MDAEVSVELGAEDPTLAIPWSSEDGQRHYYDLRSRPDLLLYVDEAARYSELREFLNSVNSSHSILKSAKCDAWFTSELSEAEAIFGAAGKFGSYVDLLFADERWQDFAACEKFADKLAKLLRRAPELAAATETIIRRGHVESGGEVQEGFYFTLYVFGYGDEEVEARLRWGIALKLVENAILQLSA